MKGRKKPGERLSIIICNGPEKYRKRVKRRWRERTSFSRDASLKGAEVENEGTAAAAVLTGDSLFYCSRNYPTCPIRVPSFGKV